MQSGLDRWNMQPTCLRWWFLRAQLRKGESLFLKIMFYLKFLRHFDVLNWTKLKGLRMRGRSYGVVPSVDRAMFLQSGMGRRDLRQAVSLLHVWQRLPESLRLQEQRAMFASRRHLYLRGRLSRQGLQWVVPRKYLRRGLRAEVCLQKRSYLFSRKWTLQLYGR